MDFTGGFYPVPKPNGQKSLEKSKKMAKVSTEW